MANQSNENINLGDDVIEVQGDNKSGLWSQRNESIFITLLDEEVGKGQRQTGCLTKQVWSKFRDDMESRTGYRYTIDQLTNKYNQLRTRWNRFQAMLEETGIGVDPIHNTLLASDEQWEQLWKNKARRLKKKGLQHYQELTRIFGDSSATEAFAYSPTMFSSSTKRKFVEKVDTAHQKSRKRDGYKASLVAVLNTFVEINKRKIKLMEMQMSRMISSGNAPSVVKPSVVKLDEARLHLKETLAALNTLDNVDGPTYAKALNKFREDVSSREIFLQLPDNRKKDWLNNI